MSLPSKRRNGIHYADQTALIQANSSNLRSARPLRNTLPMDFSASKESLLETLRELDRIGVRFAGSRGEQVAAEWIASRFRSLGLDAVSIEEFNCRSFESLDCEVMAERSGTFRVIPSEPAAHCPSTPPGGVSGPLEIVEKLGGPGGVHPRRLDGRIVLIYASEFFRRSQLQRLVAGKPAAVLVVDDRFTHDQTVAVGFPAAWINLLQCPFVNISYPSAWQLVRDGADRIVVRVKTRCPQARSTNVIAEIRGSRLAEEVVVVSAHHDTVINSSGVDDNGSGVACVLELARLFSSVRPARTIRFISFGAEEQLSEGARQYVLTCPDIARVQFVLNIDAVGAIMGKTAVYYSGPLGLRRLLDQVSRNAGQPIHMKRELSPFSDHFPFNVRGIPAVWYYRTTYVAARHYHHSRAETLSVISPQVLERTASHQARLLDEVANRHPLPFPRALSPNDLRRLRRMAQEWAE